jgi:hypothetical protein
MMEKSALAGEGGGCTATPFFTLFTITYNVAVYALAEMADTHSLFHLYPYMLAMWLSLASGARRCTGLLQRIRV